MVFVTHACQICTNNRQRLHGRVNPRAAEGSSNLTHSRVLTGVLLVGRFLDIVQPVPVSHRLLLPCEDQAASNAK
jgi:hypothetical protein